MEYIKMLFYDISLAAMWNTAPAEVFLFMFLISHTYICNTWQRILSSIMGFFYSLYNFHKVSSHMTQQLRAQNRKNREIISAKAEDSFWLTSSMELKLHRCVYFSVCRGLKEIQCSFCCCECVRVFYINRTFNRIKPNVLK